METFGDNEDVIFDRETMPVSTCPVHVNVAAGSKELNIPSRRVVAYGFSQKFDGDRKSFHLTLKILSPLGQRKRLALQNNIEYTKNHFLANSLAFRCCRINAFRNSSVSWNIRAYLSISWPSTTNVMLKSCFTQSSRNFGTDSKELLGCSKTQRAIIWKTHRLYCK